MPYSEDGHNVPGHVHGDKKRRQWSHVWNSEYHSQKGKGKSDKEAEEIAFASANSVAGKAATERFVLLLAKANEEDARAFSDALIAALEADWQNLPVEIQPSLESATLSGISQGMMQIDVSNAALLASANTVAQKYAQERAAEIVGMRRDLEGNLVPNPDARWAISDTTRERIQEIVSDAFAEETPLEQIQEAIQQALEEEADGNGIFSEARAEMIARTEVNMAQAGGNFEVWQKSGVVKSIKWLTSEDEKVCVVCEENDSRSVPIGQPFPSGDLYPGAHPNCRCVVVVDELR
jgi:SPP1 gp7 family putative phage head morphogenesis protein